MKKLFLILVAVLVFTSCTSTETDIKEVNKDGSPVWVSEVPQSKKYVYGVGSSKLSNVQNSRDSADLKARTDLARKLQATINEATSVYSIAADDETSNVFETLTIQTVELTLRGVKIEARYTSSDGTVWSLVSLEAKKVKDLYKIAANDYLNKLENKKIEVENQKAAAISDLAYKLDTATAALVAVTASLDDTAIAIAQKKVNEAKAEQEILIPGITKYADNIIKAIEIEIQKIDVDKLVKAIDAELIKKGYTD